MKDEIINIWPFNNTLNKLPEERYSSHYVYFHGKLNSDLGDDRTAFFFNVDSSHLVKVPNQNAINGDEIVSLFNGKELFREEIYLNGGYKIKVEGIEKECIGIFYTKWNNYRVSQEIRNKHLAIKPCDRCPSGISKFQSEYDYPTIRGLIVYEDDIEGLKEAILNFRDI